MQSIKTIREKLLNTKAHAVGVFSVTNSESYDFLSNEFWTLSWSASVQRALRYKNDVPDRKRADFKKSVIDYCEAKVLPQYFIGLVEESSHKRNIEKICNYVDFLNDNGRLVEKYNIGIAQKLLNLQLKYLWASGYISRPPHCPVDRIILSKTKLKNKVNWTQIETIEMYEKAILAISESAGFQHIADWELRYFRRR